MMRLEVLKNNKLNARQLTRWIRNVSSSYKKAELDQRITTDNLMQLDGMFFTVQHQQLCIIYVCMKSAAN